MNLKRPFRPRSRMRGLAVLMAWISILLNAAAPVLAYAYGDVMHDVGGVQSLQPASQPGSHSASHIHGAGSEHAHGITATHTHATGEQHSLGAGTEPAGAHEHSDSTGHCPHCLDFAAGAALGSTPFFGCAESASCTPHRSIVIARYAGRSSLRIAEPRAPPPSV